MMSFVEYNPNPLKKLTGDCVVRAICMAEDKDWDDAYIRLVMKGFAMKEIPMANNVWGSLLKDLGYTRHVIPDTCPDCYTIQDFCEEHPQGIYILGTGTHAVAVADGSYYDTWDSGEEVPINYWTKEM